MRPDSDDGLGYSGIDCDRAAGTVVAVASEHDGGDDEDRAIHIGQDGTSGGAHIAAIPARVIDGRRLAGIVGGVLVVRRVVAVVGIMRVMVRRAVIVVRTNSIRRRRLRRQAMTPRRAAGDKAKRQQTDQ